MAKLRWQRSKGVSFDLPITPEDVKNKMEEIGNFDSDFEFPT